MGGYFLTQLGCCVTNVAGFRALSEADYLEGCDFCLNGVITLVDTNRDLTVLQDASGAVALNFHADGQELQTGQLVALEGSNCCPYFAAFPRYPFHPTGRDIESSFEAPMNWGEYHLTRMRGWLHPPVTGEYTFWIASDNSSELWLSRDAHPSRGKKIASIARFAWTLSREWSRYPSQRSEPILLKAGETYYIEALAEQTTGGENLAVAWQGPSLNQSVIAASYLTPWGARGIITNGILREYWTNYFLGDLTGLAGPRPFESALGVDSVRASVLGPGELPKPGRIALDQPLATASNYVWAQVEGRVGFIGGNGTSAILELSDGRGQVQVRLSQWNPSLAEKIRNASVRVRGVCEGMHDEKGNLTPGIIWVSASNSLAIVENTKTNLGVEMGIQPFSAAMAQTDPAMEGFYSTRGVVTFNDRVFGKDYLFVQEDAIAVLVMLEGCLTNCPLKVGQWLDLGGALQPGKSVPVLDPLVVIELGFHSLPPPGNREGRWSELEGIVHSAKTNGTISIACRDGPAYLWIGQIPTNCLRRYVDEKLRARGVLLLTALDAPVLLVPSPAFVDVEEEPPEEPFTMPRRSIADLVPEKMESSWGHRAMVSGEITYHDAQSFFIQDGSGGIRVQYAASAALQVGHSVEVVAFPTTSGVVRTLTGAQVRSAREILQVNPQDFEGSEAMSAKQSGTLVRLTAILIDQKTNETGQVLVIQQQQRIFSATLSTNSGRLPSLVAGSQLRIIGVCENGTTAASMDSEKLPPAQFPASLNILLRTPSDVTILSGPPWWTSKRAITLVGALLTVLAVTLLWVNLLQRQLERQQAAQLAYSRQVLAQVEEERRRIAVNLHDSLGQILLAIKNQALLAIQRPPDQQGMRERLDEISGASSQAIEEVRQITHGLRPYQLDRLGLTQAIRASVDRVSANSSILVASRVENIDGMFDKEAEIHIYRIVQEAVTNMVRHSAATEAAVVIKKRSAVVLSIRDNGRGFDTATPSTQPLDLGYGLVGIADRVRILGGILTIESRPGNGTSVTVEVPIPVCKT